MNSIGGYFELELQPKKEYHDNAIRLNTGRNALEYILLSKKYNKIYIPFFSCDVLLQPVKKLNVIYEFYHIDEKLEPVFDYNNMDDKSVFLYINYFGLKDGFINMLVKYCKNSIIDNSQSFFSEPLLGIDTFYSARKFFGVPDGAYLYSNTQLKINLEQDISFDRFEHLLQRVDLGAEYGYYKFRQNDSMLDNQQIKFMSKLTQLLLSSLNYKIVKKRRIENFLFFDNHLGEINKLKIDWDKNQVPMIYPFWTNKKDLKERLLNHKIFTPTYWPNVAQWVQKNRLEYHLMNEIVYLPIDQRYTEIDLKKILGFII